MFQFREKVEKLLSRASVEIGGARPWDIRVHNSRFYRRAIVQGSLGLGESYMERWWDCDRLDDMFYRILTAGIDRAVSDWHNALLSLHTRLVNLQTRAGAFRIAQRHYDLGDDIFECMLDSRMVYSCGYWKAAKDLETAQQAKLDLVAEKLSLREGMRVLDIGCGWGGAAKYFAERYGVDVLGVTVSERQAEYGRRLCHGLPVEIRLADYRELPHRHAGEFDRVFSIGMFEHAGYRNYPVYFDTVRRCLKKDGLFLLHTIGRGESITHTDPWIARYIFPRSNLPSIKQIGAACEGRFVMEDWHNFGADYDRTLLAWHENYEKHCKNLPPRYDERFHRMWRYYLLMSAAGFRARQMQLWQIVLSPSGVPGGYRSIR